MGAFRGYIQSFSFKFSRLTYHQEKRKNVEIHFVSFAGIVAFQKGTCTEGEVEGETKGTFTLAANSPCSRNERQCFILFPQFQLQIVLTKKNSSDKRSRPFLSLLRFFFLACRTRRDFLGKRGILKAYHLYISPNEPSSLSCLSSHPERQKQHRELQAILCKEAFTSTLDQEKERQMLTVQWQ